MEHTLGDNDRAAFHDELRKHVDAMQMIGVGTAAASCHYTRVYVTCPSSATIERVLPGSGSGEQASGGDAPEGTARLAAAGPIRWGPIRWGGGSCISIPGTRCFLCYEYECSR